MTDIQMIPNLDLEKDFSDRTISEGIHFETLEKLAELYGHDMSVHRHARHLQIHFILQGDTTFQIEENIYQVKGAACFLTPATVPHAFEISKDSCGFVLTINQVLYWRLFKNTELETNVIDSITPTCMIKNNLTKAQQTSWQHIEYIIKTINKESQNNYLGRTLILESLVQVLLIYLLRSNTNSLPSYVLKNNEMDIFQRFVAMVEQHFKKHWVLSQYTYELGVSEARLNQICQAIARQSSKRIINERLLKEVKRMLIFTSTTINQISEDNGFSDPAYFSRFFKQQMQQTASEFRKNHDISK